MTPFERLVDVMDRLLAPDGCPWDREQTLATLRPYLLEEAYEVLDAMDGDDPREHCEELGDLLMQIVFQSALRQREGAFTANDVCNAIADKLVRRHPHVFADATADTSEQVLTQWEEIKAAERRDKAGAEATGPDRLLRGVPRATPALARAQRLSNRAARVGFDWHDVDGCRAKVSEEVAELDAAIADGDKAAIEGELGDLLFAVVSLARKLDVDAEDALRATTDKFVRRFEYIEDRLHERGRAPAESDLDEMDALWNDAKKVTQN